MADDEETPQKPQTAEDAKRAKALASVESNTLSEDTTAGSKDVDQGRLDKAMADLSGGPKKKVEEKKMVKVNAEDVTLVVSEIPFMLWWGGEANCVDGRNGGYEGEGDRIITS